jgi:hypothetical protein
MRRRSTLHDAGAASGGLAFRGDPADIVLGRLGDGVLAGTPAS